MTGHVFHPGHDEWHGQTVVVHTSGTLTIAGRWDSIAGDQVRMMDVALHDGAAAEESKEAWIERVKTYGIPVSHRAFALAEADVARVVRLRDS